MHHKIEKLKKLKLLFVEDEVDLVEIITDTLRKLDVNFLSAKNGQEALDIIEENSDIDIIITDINMPIMNGLTMIQELRKKGYNKPIIIMSAHTESDYINKAKELGVDHYLLKPFDFIKFIDLITEMEIK
ncbi:response regulator [Halarcobacter ebronensis]|uniref:Response regulator n=1 Tax=Halarcobacter ebronensis TaxID=1462615 RepID=A0A4Q0Y9Q9_9BACT|nr:response regulator [Halarcobacter ebronensis]QKF81136.1 signal transduction response regulator [Halarcobacter ebronensis]RXJ67020.1 response regulator [Halarcobacter ebronensis]RXK03289.1 response regulator [Halarcobacter ebronensis]